MGLFLSFLILISVGLCAAILIRKRIKQIDRNMYEEWIKINEPKWKEKIESIHLDKSYYGLAKEKK